MGNLFSRGVLQTYGYCQGHPLQPFATSFSVSKIECLRPTQEEEGKGHYLPNMTLRKPGHNLSKDHSAKVSSHEAISTVKDGPEGYYEDEQIAESEYKRIEASYADSTAAQSQGKANRYRKHKYETRSRDKDTGTTANSPTLKARCLALRPSRFGTPFAYESYQTKPDFFKGLFRGSTRLLFDQVVAEASTLKELLLRNLAPRKTGGKGVFCALKKCDPLKVDFDTSEGSDGGGSKLQLHVFEPRRRNLQLHLFVNRATAPNRRTDFVQDQPR